MKQAAIKEDLRRYCLFCSFCRGVCVLDSEWHCVLHCPLFKDLLVRSSKLRDIETGSEFIESPRPSVALKILLSSCAKEPARIQPLGSFVQLSLKLRERWLQDNVVGGLQLTPAVQVELPVAQLYSTTEAFKHGVAISI